MPDNTAFQHLFVSVSDPTASTFNMAGSMSRLLSSPSLSIFSKSSSSPRILRRAARCLHSAKFEKTLPTFSPPVSNARLFLERRPFVSVIHNSSLRKTHQRDQISFSSKKKDKKKNHLEKEKNDPSLSLNDIDARTIGSLTNLAELQNLVYQLERMPRRFTGSDIDLFHLPLVRSCSRPQHGREGALLCERILFDLLKRLSASRKQVQNQQQRDEYTNNNNEEDHNDLPYPSAILYNKTIEAWSNTRTLEGAHRAQAIFDLMKELSSVTSYVENAKVNDTDASPTVPRANEMNQSSVGENEGNHQSGRCITVAPAPGKGAHVALLQAWAGASQEYPEGLNKAHSLLRKMEDLSGMTRLLEEQEEKLESILTSENVVMSSPPRKCYNALLSAYAESYMDNVTGIHALNQIRYIVSRMDRLFALTGNAHFELDKISYYAILRGYSRCASFASVHRGMAQEIKDLLTRMTKSLTQEELTGVMSMSWAHGVVVEALVKASPLKSTVPQAHEYVLSMMKAAELSRGDDKGVGGRMERSRLWPREDTILKVMQAWRNTGLMESQDRIKELMDILASIPFKYQNIEQVHEEMERLYRKRWPDAPEAIQLLLDRALKSPAKNMLRPTEHTFTIALKAWLLSDSDVAPVKSELILQKMMQLYESGDVPFLPTESHMRYVIMAWLQRCETGKRYRGMAGDNLYPAMHIEALLSLFDELNGLSSFSNLYTMGIRAWATQEIGHDEQKPNIVEQATLLLYALAQRLGELPAYPSNWALSACARKQHSLSRRKEAYDAALEIFAQCRRDSRTFVLILQVFKSHIEILDVEHIKVVEELFAECCSNGLLTQDVIWLVISMVPVESIQKLFGLNYVHAELIIKARQKQNLTTDLGSDQWTASMPRQVLVEHLPQEWSRNASSARHSAIADLPADA